MKKTVYLNPYHLDDLRNSGLDDRTIEIAGIDSADANQIRKILGFDAGKGVAIPYPSLGCDDCSRRTRP